jgi:succinylarginine dihydrolase
LYPTACEMNFDGLVGPTHNYAGLSFGNVASFNHQKSVANPKAAALQGLAKMQALASRGFAQAVLPPQMRPNLALLRQIGFRGNDAAVIGEAFRQAPEILASVYSAASMWSANAATVSPSVDTADHRVHFTVANLHSKLHRSFEQTQTAQTLQAIFADQRYFQLHPALPAAPAFGDEGAANHTRLAAAHGAPGLEMFVYGRVEFNPEAAAPKRFPARQTREASEAVARLHRLDPHATVFAAQAPEVIDQGVFHNDVIAVGNGSVLFYHARAFLDERTTLDAVQRGMTRIDCDFIPIRVTDDQLTLSDAVASYLFNSQLLSKPDGRMLLVVPQECRHNHAVAAYLQTLLASGGPIDEVISFDLHQSMRNGGGPACLRLRVVLTEAERAAMHQGVLMNDRLYQQLVDWVQQHYRDALAPADLADPQLLLESETALAALTTILGLPDLYAAER